MVTADRPVGSDPGYLGIDLGTSSVKAVVALADGTVLARASHPYPVEHPELAHAETPAALWWDAVVRAVRAAVAEGGVDVRGIGLSGQMHGVVLTGDDLEPLHPAMLWADSRATRELDAYRALPDGVRRRLGNPLMPGAAGPLLGWTARHTPGLLARARWALQPKDWLRARLTGQVASEPSDASATLLFDLIGGGWDADVAGALGVDPALLPPLLDHAGVLAGGLTPDAAAALGLPAGLPVAAGAADAAAASHGSGLARGTAQITVGTGAQVVSRLAGPPAVLSDQPVTHLYRDVTGEGYYAMAAVQNAGLALQWVLDVLRADWDELYGALDGEPASAQPLFVPHLTGERTPYLDPALRGSWVELSAGHTRADLLRASLEGVAFAAADALDSLPGLAGIERLWLSGGSSNDPRWCQLMADVTGRALHVVSVPDASGRGAAMLGAQAADDTDGFWTPPADAAGERALHTPRPDHHDRLTERRDRFHVVVESLRTQRA
ncbi:MAG: FGGY family carbohydrate kinase [Propioniciclava sp.]|uniref:xylulokinase n=1 Tax=Propioniciclava sp. TaxID=2038686 RepID=UPI0039E4B532